MNRCRCVVGHATVARVKNVKDPINEEAVVNERNPHSGSAFQAIRAIDYAVIFVRDMAAMRRFYEDILGFSNIGWATTP
jgi:catechol-2,3-dioxygenase